MDLFALSFQGEVEKYGVYVGIAAFFGLAVMSLLYFSQARELKRLREWAARAPDRAREMEQRVIAQATASATRRPPAMPGTKTGMAPARRLAEMPPTAAAQAATSAQATELADAVPAEDEPATNGNVPAAGSVPADGAGNGAEAPAAEDESGEQDVPAEGAPAAAAGAGGAAAGAAAAGAAAAAASQDDDAEEEDAAGATEDRDVAEDADSVADQPERIVATDARDGAAATRPGEVPPAIPRATPAQRVGVTPRPPAPLPLRQSRPSATPAAGAPRRPAAAPPRKPAEPPRSGRSAGTIALFVGLAVLILGGGAFAISQLGGDDEPTAPNRTSPPPTQAEQEEQDSQPARPPAETNVAVLNGTTFTGLAGQLADRVAQEGGFERGVVETNTRDQTLEASTIFYADGYRASARQIGELLSVSGIEPMDDDTQALAPEADVVVLAGADQAP